MPLVGILLVNPQIFQHAQAPVLTFGNLLQFSYRFYQSIDSFESKIGDKLMFPFPRFQYFQAPVRVVEEANANQHESEDREKVAKRYFAIPMDAQ